MVKNIVPIIPISTGATRNTANPLAVNILSWSSLVAPTVNALLNRESTARHNSYQHPTTPQYPLKPTENLPKNILGSPQHPITISNSRRAELEFQNQLLEAYSVAGEMGFSWWLVEHYLPYHVNCPDGCDSGEPARGRKDPPYFQMGYGSLDNIPDLVDPFVESPLPA